MKKKFFIAKVYQKQSNYPEIHLVLAFDTEIAKERVKKYYINMEEDFINISIEEPIDECVECI